MKTIAIIEDDQTIGDLLEEVLQKEGYAVRRAYSGTEAVYLLSQQRPDLALLDLMLPGLSGEEVLPHLEGIPVIVVSAKVGVDDKVRLLLGGAADYLTKPFRLGELRARVAAHLRRQHRTPQRRFRRGGLDFDLGEKAVYWGEQPVKLTRGEYAICEYLALHSGQTFSKEQIYEAVFGFDAPGDQAAVTEHIKNIRAKLRALDCHPIDTVWGVGYRWKRDLP